MQILTIDSLTARRDALRAEGEGLRSRLDAVLTELSEIETAVEFVRKFGEESSGSAAVVPFRRRDELPLSEPPLASALDASKLSKRELIVRILEEAPFKWMTAAEIVAKMRAMTGQPVKRQNVSPKLSDLKNEGVIARNDMKVALASRVNENGPRASEPARGPETALAAQ